MIDKNVRFLSPVQRDSDLRLASDEPSHIHIARPSRMLRQATSSASIERRDQVGDGHQTAEQRAVQAA
jgi:hypothetical protein